MSRFKDLHAEMFSDCLRYEDGHLVRIKGPRLKKETIIKGTLGTNGRLWFNFKRETFSVHRVIWCLLNGSLSGDLDIDHIDGNPINNKIDNLRVATRAQNMQNLKKARSTSLTGVLGVSFIEKRNVFRASIEKNGKYYRKTFPTIEEASEWYINKKREIHPFGTI